MENEKVYTMKLSKIYPLLLTKVTRKGREKKELDYIITWLTGYSEVQIDELVNSDIDYRSFFDNCPAFNPDASKITGRICNIKVEEIEDPLMQKIRYLDKIVDELAKGKTIEKITNR